MAELPEVESSEPLVGYKICLLQATTQLYPTRNYCMPAGTLVVGDDEYDLSSFLPRTEEKLEEVFLQSAAFLSYYPGPVGKVCSEDELVEDFGPEHDDFDKKNAYPKFEYGVWSWKNLGSNSGFISGIQKYCFSDTSFTIPAHLAFVEMELLGSVVEHEYGYRSSAYRINKIVVPSIKNFPYCWSKHSNYSIPLTVESKYTRLSMKFLQLCIPGTQYGRETSLEEVKSKLEDKYRCPVSTAEYLHYDEKGKHYTETGSIDTKRHRMTINNILQPFLEERREPIT